MSENKRSRRVLVIVFFGIYVAMVLRSISSCEGPFGPWGDPFVSQTNPIRTRLLVKTLPQSNPFGSDQDGFDGRGGSDSGSSNRSSPAREYTIVWPMKWCSFDADVNENLKGRLYALYHIRAWRISWLPTIGFLSLLSVVSWLASIGISYVIAKTGLRISLSTLFALTVIVAISMKDYQVPSLPQDINPIVFQLQAIIASFAKWVATLACYLSVFVGFQPRFIYDESMLYIRGSRSRAVESE